MTDHEMLLLRAAVEACQERGVEFELSTAGMVMVYSPDEPLDRSYYGFNADALSALLTDLDADVPEWPSEERVAELRADLMGVGEYGVAADLPLPEYLALRGGP